MKGMVTLTLRSLPKRLTAGGVLYQVRCPERDLVQPGEQGGTLLLR